MSAPWTDATVDRLRNLHAKGLTCSQVAHALNAEFGTAISRNGVIGKLHRLGLGGIVNPPPKSTKTRAPDPRHASAPAALPTEPPAQPPVAPAVEPGPRKPGKGVAMTELRERSCRWPLWGTEARGGLYCGELTAESPIVGVPPRPYCEHHCRLAFTPVQPRLRLPVRRAA